MATRAFDSVEDIPLYEGSPSYEGYESEFYAGERVCPPGTLGRRRSILRTLFWVALLGGLSAAWMKTPEDWKFAAAAQVDAVVRGRSLPSVEPVEMVQEVEAAPVTETKEIAKDPAAGAGEPVQAEPSTEPSPPAESVTGIEPPPEPLTPPKADPGDPYQKRALAAGLHPDISRALLTRMSEADFANAGVAIDRAMKGATDGKHYAWPKEGAGGKLALFEVRFVRAALPECRRYVVTVTKDRWATTAPPMERCSQT